MSSSGAPILLEVVIWIGLGPCLGAGLWLDLSAGFLGIRTALGRPSEKSTPPGLPFHLLAWFAVFAVRRSSGFTVIPSWVFLGLITLHFLAFSWAYFGVLRRGPGRWECP